MKRNKLNILALALLLLIFFGLSLTPCIQYEIGVSPSYAFIRGLDPESLPVTVHYTSYMPRVIGAIVLIQLLMLLLRPRVVYRVLGLIMTLLCAVVPLPLFAWLDKFLSAIFSTSNPHSNYRPTYAGWLLWGFGLLIILLYISEIRLIRKGRAKAAAPGFPEPAPAPAAVPGQSSSAEAPDQAAILAAMQQENKNFNREIQNDNQGGNHHE